MDDEVQTLLIYAIATCCCFAVMGGCTKSCISGCNETELAEVQLKRTVIELAAKEDHADCTEH